MKSSTISALCPSGAFNIGLTKSIVVPRLHYEAKKDVGRSVFSKSQIESFTGLSDVFRAIPPLATLSSWTKARSRDSLSLLGVYTYTSPLVRNEAAPGQRLSKLLTEFVIGMVRLRKKRYLHEPLGQVGTVLYYLE